MAMCNYTTTDTTTCYIGEHTCISLSHTHTHITKYPVGGI